MLKNLTQRRLNVPLYGAVNADILDRLFAPGGWADSCFCLSIENMDWRSTVVTIDSLEAIELADRAKKMAVQLSKDGQEVLGGRTCQ
jgi:hypothetical protein